MIFVDEAEILIVSGKGGQGCISFRREKYMPKGGPDGGDGGNGGDVHVVARKKIKTLAQLGGKRLWKAKNGEPGRGSNCHGANGEVCIIEVPVGTTVIDVETEEILFDLDEDKQEWVAAAGGRGGKGNTHYKSSRQQTPRKAQKGEPGFSRRIRLELKLLADIGLVGMPNAGKSTLLSALTNARPETAPYPFTTLTPQLGVLQLDDYITVTIADIPGLIEGAHQGIGLGLRFLKHIERTSLILYILDGSDPDLHHHLQILQKELYSYTEVFKQRDFLIICNKLDLVPLAEQPEHQKAIASRLGTSPIWISAREYQNIDGLMIALTKKMKVVNP